MSVGIEIDSKALAGRFPNAYNESRQIKYRVGPRKKCTDRLHNNWVEGYEYNEKQYIALIKLAIVLKRIFPLMKTPNGLFEIDFPRTKNGRVIKSKIASAKQHRGFICHYNNSSSKIDPISFDHLRFVLGVNEDNPHQGSTFIVLTTWKGRQRWLTKLGYNPGLIDGIYGPKTKKAIQNFQVDNILNPSGKWDSKIDYIMNFRIREFRG
jgi:hypothetical protein